MPGKSSVGKKGTITLKSVDCKVFKVVIKFGQNNIFLEVERPLGK